METKDYLEKLINNELERMVSEKKCDDINLITKLIDAYVEYNQTECLVQAVMKLANGKMIIDSVSEKLSVLNFDEEISQQIFEHTISCIRLNSCDATKLIIDKIKNVDVNKEDWKCK